MSKNKELAQDYFARHANDECFITSDGRVFHSKGTADSYASSLKDNKVETYTRKETSEEVEEVDKTDTLDALKNFSAETSTYEEAKVLVKALGIKAASNSKADLFAAIALEQSKLEQPKTE